ncbi:MAG TPA: glycosyltransferase [Bacteroidales bacterium]|nr:glycosyltransferase [Bacteroidales bacterium]
MNILFCYGNWMNPRNGGVQKVSDTLARYFANHGHSLYYITWQYEENDNYHFPALTYHLPDKAILFTKENKEYYHWLLSELKIDVLLNHDASNYRNRFFLDTGIHKAKKISVYHTDPLNGLNSVSELSKSYVLLINRHFPSIIHWLKVQKKRSEISYLLKKSHKLVVLSQEFKKQIGHQLKINSVKIEAINNPTVYSGNHRPVVKKKQLLFVARMELAVKRPDKMLLIWSKLEKDFNDWKLIFLGDGPDRKTIEEIASSLSVKNVDFKGFADPIPYYEDSSIICMTSDYEGFGLVLIEAMQFGTVPIAFNNWISLKDIIVHNETGILVETRNIDDYIVKLKDLMINEDKRNQISVAARSYAKRFHIDTIGSQWLNLLNQLEN